MDNTNWVNDYKKVLVDYNVEDNEIDKPSAKTLDEKLAIIRKLI